MADRVAGFLINAQKAASDSGHHIKINLRPIEPRPWMIPTFSPDVLRDIVRQLPAGLAVEGREGPDGHPFTGATTLRASGGAFYPVVGLASPPLSGELWSGAKSTNGMMIDFGDNAALDFTYRLLKSIRITPARSYTERITVLRAFAVSEAGEAQADNLVEVWLALNEAQAYLQTLNFGDVLRMGHVLNRWMTRPMVPFPSELTEAEKKDYRPFLFQAKDEEQAGDLVDIQAMRMYEGWGARLLFQRTVELTIPRLQRARQLVEDIQASARDNSAKSRWEIMARRIQAVIDLVQSADNMVSYEAQLDRVKSLKTPVETNPVLGVQSSWDRTDLMEIARSEIDTTIDLKRLLESTPSPLLDTGSTPKDESSMRLGPNVAAQLTHKIEVMNAHWRDYDRLFTRPNP